MYEGEYLYAKDYVSSDSDDEFEYEVDQASVMSFILLYLIS